MRFEVRKLLVTGWCVWDLKTGAPALVEKTWQTDLTRQYASELTKLLNRLDATALGNKRPEGNEEVAVEK